MPPSAPATMMLDAVTASVSARHDSFRPNRNRMRSSRLFRSFRCFVCVTGLTLVAGHGAFARTSQPSARGEQKNEAKWITNFNNAAGQARNDDKLILAYFRGSDWCPSCKKLDKEVLNTDPFIEWAEKNVVLLDVDFPADKKQSPAQKKQNEALKDRYGVLKTPTFVFLDSD